MHDDVFSEIGRFDQHYTPDAGIRPGLQTLADGDYEMTVLEASITRTPNTNDPIMKLWLKATTGQMAEMVYFFKTQEAINKVGYDLQILGFTEFSKTGKFSEKLKAAIGKLTGLTFRCRKVTESGSDGKTYHKLLMHGRAGTGAARPATSAMPRQTTPSDDHAAF